MGMLKSYLKVILLLHKRRSFAGSVCVLGNQEIWADIGDLKECFREMGVPFREPKAILPHTSRMFASDSVLAEMTKGFVHAKVFFDMLGMEEYIDMDKFDTDQPGILHDLNLPVSETLHRRYDLVIDGGTVEHIFDVKAVLGNMVRMTKVSGHVMHIATFQIDHGFYSFSPCLFFDFYRSNGFDDFECFIMPVDYSNILQTFRAHHDCFGYRYGDPLPKVLSDRQPLLVFFIARKTVEVSAIAAPTQGLYDASLKPAISEMIPSRTAQGLLQRVVNGIPSWLRPYLRPLRPLALTLIGPLLRQPDRHNSPKPRKI